MTSNGISAAVAAMLISGFRQRIKKELDNEERSKGKGWRKSVLHFVLLFVCMGFIYDADAADWRTLVQPVGTENIPFLIDPALLNAAYSAGKGPWDSGTTVTSIKTTVPLFFVRFYNPTAALNPSRQEGSWVMRASVVRGLNAQQIRDLFALPNTPTMMTLGLSTTGVSLYTGVAAPIAGWGNGGGQQSQSYSGPYTTFFNAQSVMDGVLCYQTMASSPNLATIGSYLVAHTPDPYSDMETLYNSLDVLYNPASYDLFNRALKSISPTCLDNIATAGIRAVLLQNHAIDDRIDLLSLHESESGIWSKAVRSYQHYSAAGFDGDMNGVIIGADKKTSANILSGISLAWMQGGVSWYDGGGKAAVDYYRVAAYSALLMHDAFLQATLSAGLADGHSSRNIYIGTFYQPSQYGPATSPLVALSRTAQGDYRGWNGDFTLRSGTLLRAGPLTILPSAAVGYLYQSRGGFNESGAGALDFTLSEAQSQTFHSDAGIRLDREFLLSEHQKITPYISISWAYEKRLDDRAVTASMNGWNDSFTTYSPLTAGHTGTGSAGLMMSLNKSLLLIADYITQAGSGYRDCGFEAGLSWIF